MPRDIESVFEIHRVSFSKFPGGITGIPIGMSISITVIYLSTIQIEFPFEPQAL